MKTEARAPGRPAGPWRCRRSIASRLGWLYVGTTALLLLVAEGYLHWGLSQSLRAQDEQLLASKTHVLRLLLRDPAKAQALESEIEHEAGEHQALKYYLRVLGPDGRIHLETSGMSARLPTAVFPPIATAGGDQPVIAEHGTEFLVLVARAAYGQSGAEPRTLHIALDTSMNQAILAECRGRLLVVFAAGTALAALAALFVTRAGLRPLHDIRRNMQRITASKLDERLSAQKWPAELRELAGEFDAMLDRLQNSFTRLAEFSSDLAHAMRNPINNLRGGTEVALTRARTPEEYRGILASSLEEYERLSRLIGGLLFIARADDPRAALERVAFPVRVEMDAVREFYEAVAAERRVEVACTGDASLSGDPALVRRAVSNLLANALKCTPAGGRVTLGARSLPDGGVEVSAADTGCGIAPEHLPRLFERFFQVDKTRQANNGDGAGLGLAIVRSIMRLHGGEASITSTPGVGSTVTLRFPAAPVSKL